MDSCIYTQLLILADAVLPEYVPFFFSSVISVTLALESIDTETKALYLKPHTIITKNLNHKS